MGILHPYRRLFRHHYHVVRGRCWRHSYYYWYYIPPVTQLDYSHMDYRDLTLQAQRERSDRRSRRAQSIIRWVVWACIEFPWYPVAILGLALCSAITGWDQPFEGFAIATFLIWGFKSYRLWWNLEGRRKAHAQSNELRQRWADEQRRPFLAKPMPGSDTQWLVIRQGTDSWESIWEVEEIARAYADDMNTALGLTIENGEVSTRGGDTSKVLTVDLQGITRPGEQLEDRAQELVVCSRCRNTFHRFELAADHNGTFYCKACRDFIRVQRQLTQTYTIPPALVAEQAEYPDKCMSCQAPAKYTAKSGLCMGCEQIVHHMISSPTRK